MTNRELVERYPFLIPRNVWTGEIARDYNPDEYTTLDAMPDGWRAAFGEEMCEELRNELIRFDYLDKYRVTQIKEKYGSLRWYDSGAPIGITSKDYVEYSTQEVFKHYKKFEKMYPYDLYYSNRCILEDGRGVIRYYRYVDKCRVHDIISKYEALSMRTCIECGKPATKMSTGWISPYCDEHSNSKYEQYVPLEEWFEDDD